jgi:hypothetical protein
VTLYEDALRALGYRPPSDSPLESVILGKALERDLDGALKILEIASMSDVGEDPESSRLIDGTFDPQRRGSR